MVLFSRLLLRLAKLSNDDLADLSHGACICVNHQIRSTISGFALFQHGSDGFKWIIRLKQWAIRLAFDAIENGFKF